MQRLDLPVQMDGIALNAAVRLTRYAMRGFEGLKKLLRWPYRPLLCVFQTLADTLFDVGTGGNVEQPLIGTGVLHDGCGLSLHRKH